MVCIKNNLKVHTQKLKLGSTDKFRESIKVQIQDGEIEFAITLRNEELLNHDNCTWLSIGDASSPSSCSKHNGLSGYMDLKIDAWFISLLSTESPTSDTLLNTKVTFFDGSQVNPMEEASLILDQRKVLDEDMVFQENLEEEEVVLSLSWLDNESSDSYQEQTSGQTLNKKSKSKLAYFDNSVEHLLFSSSSSSEYSSEIMDLEELSDDYRVAADEVDRLTEKYDRKHKIVLQDLLLVDKLNVEGVIIEQVLGLGEFDGHEGIESEFNKDHFSIV